MNEMDPLKRHYLLIFPMAFMFLSLGIVFNAPAIFVSFFILSFLWVWGILTPGLREKVRSPKYKFSFFRFMYWIERKVEEQLIFETKFSLKFLTRDLGPIVFSFILSLLGGFQILLASFIGVLVGEIWLYTNKKFYLDTFQKIEESTSENSL